MASDKKVFSQFDYDFTSKELSLAYRPKLFRSYTVPAGSPSVAEVGLLVAYCAKESKVSHQSCIYGQSPRNLELTEEPFRPTVSTPPPNDLS